MGIDIVYNRHNRRLDIFPGGAVRFPNSVPILLLLFAALGPGTSHAGAEEADRLYSLGRERIAAGEYRQAEQAIERAVVENPHHGEALLQLASLYSRNILTYGK